MRPPRHINPYKLFYGSMVPNWLMCRTECTPGAKLMYARLAQYAGENGVCVPSQDQLSQALGVSERHVRRYIAELTRLKLIENERRGMRKTNRYYFRMHPWIKADMALRARVDEAPNIPDRTSTSAPDRTHMSAPDRTSTSGLDRTYSVKEDASTPSGTKASGSAKESVLRESKERESLGRESVQETETKQPPPPPTPPVGSGRSVGVQAVEVVDSMIALAHPDNGKASSSSPYSPAFDAFMQAWGHRRGQDKAWAQWQEKQLDASLDAILEALAWQQTRTGLQALPDRAWVWLNSGQWKEPPPRQASLALMALMREPDWHCGERGCDEPQGILSRSRCDWHANAFMTQEAKGLLYYLETPGHHGDLRSNLQNVAFGSHEYPVACAIAERLSAPVDPDQPWTHARILALVTQLQTDAEAARRAQLAIAS